MSHSIVRLLVLKDLRLMRLRILCYWLGGFASVGIVLLGGDLLGLAGFIFFVSAIAGAGTHAIFATVVEERREQTLAFIMSLPITVKEYTSAKLIANSAMFLSVWGTLSVAAFYIAFFRDAILPAGMIPFFTIILVAILAAHAFILAVALISESFGAAIFASVVGNLAAQLFLWAVADLYGIRSVLRGTQAVWNPTAVGTLIGEVLFVVALIAGTYVMQVRKKDFI